VACGVAGAVVVVLHKSWLLSQYGYAPGLLASAQVGGRLYELKRREEAATSSQTPTRLTWFRCLRPSSSLRT
jgi:hypothetical protein